MQNLAVITGGTKGIGKALVKIFAKQGFSISTCSRNEDDLETLKKEIHDLYDSKIHVSQADLSNREEISEFVEFNRMIGKPKSLKNIH